MTYHETVPAPTTQRVVELLNESKARKACLGLFTQCTVEYDGRASSSLDGGDRLVLIKPDGTVLVHTDEGTSATNYQPSGATVKIESTTPLTIVARQGNPVEMVTIECREVYAGMMMKMTDNADLRLHGSESDLQQQVMENPELIESGLRPLGRIRTTAAGP